MRRLPTTIALAIPLFLWSKAGAASAREDVARRWAPVLYQQVKDPGVDVFTAFDFDHDWAGDDNEENLACALDATKCVAGSPCAGGACALTAKVYFTVIETATHWYVQYLPYHSTDGKVTNGHEHDTESVFAVVVKDGTALGRLQAMETRFHDEWYTYADPTVSAGVKQPNGGFHFDTTGHPTVTVQAIGHGFCGGYSPRLDFLSDLQLICYHDQAPREDGGTLVIYRPDQPVVPARVVAGQTTTTGYAMEEILTTFWARRSEVGPGHVFKDLVDFLGERCTTLACPKQYGGALMGDRGVSPSGPWNQEPGAGAAANGDQFFDPAFTMSRRLRFPAPFSVDYCFHPYLGIADACGRTEDAGLTPAATTSTDPTHSSSVASDAPDTSEGSSSGGCTTSGTPSSFAGMGASAFALALALSRRRRRAQ